MYQIIDRINKFFKGGACPSAYKDYYVLENSFSPEEIAKLKEERERLKNDPNSKKDRAEELGKKNQLYIIHPKSELFSKLKEKVGPLLPFSKDDFEYYSMNFYHLQLPYGLHCDYLGPEKGHYQIVIPLEINEGERPPYTIIFDQTSPINTEWISKVYNKPADYKPFHNKPIYDPTYYPGWKDEYLISDSDGVKYWGEYWNLTYREAYKGFSIKYAYPWKVGDLFLFDSRYNHCASMLGLQNFPQTKDGILICLQRPEKS